MDKTAQQDVPEAELVPAPVPEAAPGQLAKAVTVGPTQLRKQMKRDEDIREIVEEYIKNNMVEGKDFGSIQVNGATSKPSLFKPGAEKFCGLFKIRATFKKDIETIEMFGNKPGIIAYICELVDSRGQVIGEGRGAYSVSPSAKDFDINKAIKIAEKRAQVDAVLRAGGLSDFFTQDMEDMPRDGGSSSNSGGAKSGPATDKQRNFVKKLLDERGIATEEQAGYLTETFGVEIPLTKEGASFAIEQLMDEKAADDDARNSSANPDVARAEDMMDDDMGGR